MEDVKIEWQWAGQYQRRSYIKFRNPVTVPSAIRKQIAWNTQLKMVSHSYCIVQVLLLAIHFNAFRTLQNISL